MKQVFFKELEAARRGAALEAIVRSNHSHNYIPIYTRVGIEKAITDPRQSYDPDKDYRFYEKGNKIKVEGKYVAFL